MANKSFDLDVDSPEKVKAVLQVAVEAYFESAEELKASWQDRNAGKEWIAIARIFDRAVSSLDKIGL
jgi:hypothetical protein